MNENKTERRAHLCVVGLTAAFIVWLLIKYATAAAIPIGISVLIASVLRPLAVKLSRGSGRPEKVYGAILTIVVVFAVFYGLFRLGGKLIHELTEFLSVTLSDLESDDNIIKRCLGFVEGIKSRFPVLGRLSSEEGGGISQEIYETVTESLKEIVKGAGRRMTSFVAGFIAALPKVAFACAVSVISVFYLTIDYEGIKKGLRSIMPSGTYNRLAKAASRGSDALNGCLKAYFVLMLLTFAELLFGFIFLKIKYAFLLAAVTAVVDILPVFGVGTVLIPWGVFLLISGETGKGVGLFVLFGIMYAVRQFAEPRLVGRFTGIHPMITLVSAYMGYSLFGIAGLLASPVVLYVMKSVFSSESAE